MNNLLKSGLLCLSIICICSCEKIVLGDDPIDTSENNFELLWQDFEEHYALFGVKNIDWQELYDRYRRLVSPTTTESELWIIMTDMLEHLDDGHTIIEDYKNELFFESGDSLNRIAEEVFSLAVIKANYLESLQLSEEAALTFGKIKNKDIGYLNIEEMEGDNPETITQIMEQLNQHQAIIIDIRNNGGGKDSYARTIAGAFADGEHFIYTVQTRNGKGQNDFDTKKEWFTKPIGATQFLKPVILLTDRFTASAAEIFALNMRSFEQVSLIGDWTAGDFSDQSNARFLPNGWVYNYANKLFLLPDNSSLEGIGVTPEIILKNTKANLMANEDIVMEKAIDYLFETYGIE